MTFISRRTIRVAVLVAFTIPSGISKSRGGFDIVFRDWLQKCLQIFNSDRNDSEKYSIETTAWDIVYGSKYPDVSELDALIVTGSTASAYDKEPWIAKLEGYLRYVYDNASHVRIFGGCFGHQIMAQALLGKQGVQVHKSRDGWEIGVFDVTVTVEFTAQFPRLLEGKPFSYQLLHADHVILTDGVPDDWILLGKTPLCEVQGFLKPGRVLTYQGHPEFDSFINGKSVLSLAALNGFTEDEIEGYMTLVNRPDQAKLAGCVLIDFFVRASN